MNWFTESDDARCSEFGESLELLRQSTFFSSLPMEALKLFAYLCHKDRYRSGEELMVTGEDDGNAFYIIEGSVALILPHGQGERCVRRFGVGQFLGCLSLLGSMPRLFTIRAEEDTLCLVLTRERFFRAMQQFPALWPRVFSGILKRIMAWESQMLAASNEAPESPPCPFGVSAL